MIHHHHALQSFAAARFKCSVQIRWVSFGKQGWVTSGKRLSWAERFTSEQGYKPLQVRVLCTIEDSETLTRNWSPALKSILTNPLYYDPRASDKHIQVGGTADAQLGFAGCALPVVLSHNTPNNSVYILWGPESFRFFGLFPRVSRHREF